MFEPPVASTITTTSSTTAPARAASRFGERTTRMISDGVLIDDVPPGHDSGAPDGVFARLNTCGAANFAARLPGSASLSFGTCATPGSFTDLRPTGGGGSDGALSRSVPGRFAPSASAAASAAAIASTAFGGAGSGAGVALLRIGTGMLLASVRDDDMLVTSNFDIVLMSFLSMGFFAAGLSSAARSSDCAALAARSASDHVVGPCGLAPLGSTGGSGGGVASGLSPASASTSTSISMPASLVAVDEVASALVGLPLALGSGFGAAPLTLANAVGGVLRDVTPTDELDTGV